MTEWNQSGWQPKHCDVTQVSSFGQTVFARSRKIWDVITRSIKIRRIYHITAIRSNTPIRHWSKFFLWTTPLWPLICSLFTLSSTLQAKWLPRLTSQTDSAHSPCNSAVNRSGAYFLNFKNSQKIEEKSYDYNFFTNVIRTKRTFFAAKKKIGIRGPLKVLREYN